AGVEKDAVVSIHGAGQIGRRDVALAVRPAAAISEPEHLLFARGKVIAPERRLGEKEAADAQIAAAVCQSENARMVFGQAERKVRQRVNGRIGPLLAQARQLEALVAFVRRAGAAPLLQALRRANDYGEQLQAPEQR